MLNLAVSKKLFRKLRNYSNRDLDIDQARLRVIVCAVAFGYVWYLILSGGALTAGLRAGLVASLGDLLVGVCMIWWLRKTKVHTASLRYLAIFADNIALTVGMAGAGEYGVAMFGVYLFVTVGNGFRFGPRYLLASYFLSIVGFVLQLLFVPYWKQHQPIGVGLLIAQAIVPLYVLVLLIRLTAHKDDVEQLSNAKSRFVANVSHELRTPLTGVFAVYDLLRGRKMTPDDRELVGMLGSAVKTLKASVDAVLQMSKLEAGAERAEKRPFNLWFLLQQLAALVRPQSATKGLAWRLTIEPDVPPTVVGDPGHLSHVLGNLLNNAFKFTAKGSVSLRVSRAGTDRVRFEVTDTGIGIPLEQQERLFERFVQVDNSASRRHGGTGLGTSIARDLTELMGGKIGVVSAPGQGSSFWVELPLPLGELEAGPAELAGGSKVLVIGPKSDLRDKIITSLQSLGVEPIAGEAAVENAPSFDAQAYFAAVLALPPAEAAAYVSTVLRDRAGVACPWVVASSAFTEMQRASLVRNGAAALLSPPLSLDVLRLNLSALSYRLEMPVSDESGSLQTTGIVRPLNILLADDNKSNQLLLSRILGDAGHTVHTATRGDAAFDTMAAGGIDLAILDLNMPDMTGPDVIKLFRASSIGGAKLPIMILSADATPAAKQESIEAGADEYLTKPVTSQALLAAIERLSAGTAARAEVQMQVAQPDKTIKTAPRTLVDQDRLQALRRISRGDAKFLDTYVQAAFADLERALSALSVAATGNDVRAARDALHIIEGTAASLGATSLVENCQSMRHYLGAGQDPDRADALAELSTIYALTKSTLLAGLHETRGRAQRPGTVR